MPVDNVDISFSKEYAPFVSSGMVSLLGSSEKTAVQIFKRLVLPSHWSKKMCCLFQGSVLMEKWCCRGWSLATQVYCCILSTYLQCDLVVGSVTVGVKPSIPVKGVALILGNDLVGQRVTSADSGMPLHWYLHAQLFDLWPKERNLRQLRMMKRSTTGRK